MAEREGTPMVDGPAHGVLGTLWLVGKKTGVDLQSFPIDAETMTIGRDMDSDIRLYFSDVSKLHCEIKFDLPAGDAFLHVHGRQGVKHALQGGELITYTPPSIIPLNDNDTFIVRKKVFRFEYGHQDALIDTPPTQTCALPSDSPVKSATPVPFQRRKRVSHRMSLVPSGKNFEPFASPMKSRRHSIIGLGDGPKMVRTPKKSGLSKQVEEEEEQDDEEEEEVIVEAIEGEDGDVLYLEPREDESVVKPVHNNPFMTPQQKRKAPTRNTSAVPRTRKLAPSSAELEEAEHVVEGAACPRTPRSVPLPPTAETPYGSVENSPVAPVQTPRSIPLPPTNNTPYVVPAQVAMSTPKGPVSLHKALLLRSARKAWQSNQAQGVDGAIQSGSVTTKRKSLSPSTKARKSLSAAPVVEETEEDVDVSDQDDDEEEGQLQWVYEDGTAAQSVDESDSSIDSLEADQSLDIPGQGVISFGSLQENGDEILDEEAALNQKYDESSEADDNDHEYAFEAQEMEEAELNPQQEEDEAEDEEGDLYEAEGQDEAERNEQDNIAEEDESYAEPEQSYRPLERFYTPQPQRTSGTTGPRRSLASFGGPATRLPHLPATPLSTVRRMPGTPGTLGLPSRRIAPPVVEDDDEDEKDSVAPSTPVRRDNAALLAEAKRRRETLGTPRAFPTVPTSFKTPVREQAIRSNIVQTPSHPALAPTTPESEAGDADHKPAVPLTPAQKVQKKLDTLRRQSVHRLNTDSSRRATVSFALPSTPARPQPKASASYSVVGQQRTFAMTKEEDEGASEPNTPIMAGQDEGDISSLEHSPHGAREMEEEEANAAYEQAKTEPEAGPATPSFAGMKEMFRSAPPPKTPSFAGVRSMYPTTPHAAPTPHYNGMKKMFQQPQEPATPHMNGMREMYNLPQDPATPDMEGLGEMYELEEVEQAAELETDTESEEEEMIEEGSEIIAVISPIKPEAKSVAVAAKKAPAASRIQAPVAVSSKGLSAVRAATSKVPVATAAARSRVATATGAEKKTVSTTTKKPAAAATSSTASRARPAAKATGAKRAIAVPVARPRPGDIDDVSLSEIDEPIEFYEPAKAKAEVPKPKPVRSTAARAKKIEEPAASVSAPVPVKKAAPKSTTASLRAKKSVLGENEDQTQSAESAIPVLAPAKATRAKKVTEKPSAASTASSTSKPSMTTAAKKTTAKAKVEKENEPDVEKPMAVKKAPVRRTVKKAEPVVPEPVVTTRTTRSRK